MVEHGCVVLVLMVVDIEIDTYILVARDLIWRFHSMKLSYVVLHIYEHPPFFAFSVSSEESRRVQRGV